MFVFDQRLVDGVSGSAMNVIREQRYEASNHNFEGDNNFIIPHLYIDIETSYRIQVWRYLLICVQRRVGSLNGYMGRKSLVISTKGIERRSGWTYFMVCV